MTIKDAKAAAEIAAMCPEAWWLIGLALPSGMVVRPISMSNAKWKEATRYMTSRGIATENPATKELVLMGTLADTLFGVKEPRVKKERQDKPAWVTMMEERGGDPQSIYAIVREQHGSAAADFYREQLALAYQPKPGADVHEKDWPQPYKDFIKYVNAVALIWGRMGKYPLLDNVLALPVKNQLSFKSMGLKHIAAAKDATIVQVLTAMQNKSDLTKKYNSVPLTLNEWLSRRL
jgi:hypothetical protein